MYIKHLFILMISMIVSVADAVFAQEEDAAIQTEESMQDATMEPAAPSTEAMQAAEEAEAARTEFGTVTASPAGGEKVVGVTAIDTFLNAGGLIRMSIMQNPDMFTGAADRFGVYLKGYLASSEGVKLAEVDESRLKDLMTEIEAGQLGAREGEKENKWLGLNAIVGGSYGYSKIKGLGFVPLKHARLQVSVPQTKERFSLTALPPYSTTGSSDPLMAYNAATDIRELIAATPEQRELVNQIVMYDGKAAYLKAGGWLLPLLAGAEYIAAGYLAQVWEERADKAGDKTLGFTITKWACYGMGGFCVVAAPINPIMELAAKSKARKLKKQYNEKYGERYVVY